MNVFFLIFTLSGFSGLIYESIWTHYLKLFLGHAAYAQTLVLAIFMGGLAAGSWICSKYSDSWKHLLAGYALAEGAIGMLALIFHPVFDQTVLFSYNSIIPHLHSAIAATVYKWTVAALLILPQSILLGMTFPLMSAGIMRQWPQNPGKTISLLYFANSIGAVVGVLASGFILIRLLGLPGTIATAGLINIFLAITVWVITRGPGGEFKPAVPEKNDREQRGQNGYFILFLAASFITGAASFIYEIGWIRMLSLVLGSSTHAFELMLSAFILGLALGGLWLQRRIDRIRSPERSLAFVQIIMGLLALSTLPLYGRTFGIMQWLVTSLSKTDTGYVLFNLSGNAIALAVMLPATFCAGMTLPLITYILLKKGSGERSIGAVYASNTAGAIVGVFFAIHIGMPHLGLKGLIIFGAALDMILGILLAWSAAGYTSKRVPTLAGIVCACSVAAVIGGVHLDLYKMSSGVYRTGSFLQPDNSTLLYYRDGKTATVSVAQAKNGDMFISTNGKVDAGINMDPDPSAPRNPDEDTMILLGVIPMALNPDAATAAAIGFGSGLTTHTLLSNPRLKQVDTIEIEKNMVEAANRFRPRVERAYTDPRSAIYIDDAKTFFSVQHKRYDIIVSEPSNPWVSGVAGLFSEEFYGLIKQHLTENGLFVQWVQLYDIDERLVVSILKAIDSTFSDYAVYGADETDMVIVARQSRLPAQPDRHILELPDIARALDRTNIRNMQDLEIRKIGDRKYLRKLLAAFPIRANSDYHPVLDQDAARARFLSANATAFHILSHDVLPAFELFGGTDPFWKVTDVTPSGFFHKAQGAHEATLLRDYYLHGSFDPQSGDIPFETRQQAAQLRQIFFDCRSGIDQNDRFIALFNTAVKMTAHLTPGELAAVWKKLESGGCARSLSPTERNWIELFKAIGKRDAPAMVRTASMVLETGQPMPPAMTKYGVASGMLGFLMQGDRAGSLRLWSTYGSGIVGAGEPDLLLRLLVAESTIPD
jgi:spermidine synthase